MEAFGVQAIPFYFSPKDPGGSKDGSRMDTGIPGRAGRGRGAGHPTSAWNHPTALSESPRTRAVCPQGQEQLSEQMGTGFFLFLFLSPKLTHGLQANQTHPRIPALPRRDSYLFKLDPFKHLHRSLGIAGAVELKPMNIHSR